MNKVELKNAVAEKTGKSKKDIEQVLTALQEVVYETMVKEEVKLIDGITVSTKTQAARTARNPQTGATVNVDAKIKPVVKIGTALKKAIGA